MHFTFSVSLLEIFVFALLLADTRAASNYFGKFIGSLKQYHHALAGDVYVVDSRTLHIRNFNYDGEGPAGYFYVSNTKTPNENGIKLRDERGSTEPLKRYRKKHITLTLPEGKTISNIKWFYVWCDEFAVNFGDVKIAKNLDFPKPQKIGRLAGVHAVASDNVVVVDAQTLLIPSFSYDGEAPDAKFWVGNGNKPTPQGVRVPDENGKEDPLRKYDKKTIVLTLPGDITVFDIGNFAIWCEAFTVDFGHIEIPKDLNVPPSLKMLGVSPQKYTYSIPSPFHLETVLHNLYSELLENDTNSSTDQHFNRIHLIKIRDTSNNKNSSTSGAGAGYVYNARQIRLETNAASPTHNCSHSISSIVSNNGNNRSNGVRTNNSSTSDGRNNISYNGTYGNSNTHNSTSGDYSNSNNTHNENREVVEIITNRGSDDVEPIKLIENDTTNKPIKLTDGSSTKNYSELMKLILNESKLSDSSRRENSTTIPLTNSIVQNANTTNTTGTIFNMGPLNAGNTSEVLAKIETSTENGSSSVEIIKSISMEYQGSISSGKKYGPYGGVGFGDFTGGSSSSNSNFGRATTIHRGSTVSKIIDLTDDGDGFNQQYNNLYTFEGEGFGLKNIEVKGDKRRKPSRKGSRPEKLTSGSSAGKSADSSKKGNRGRGRTKKSQSERPKFERNNGVSASDINSMLFWNESPSGRRLQANDPILESTDLDGNRFSYDIAIGDE